MKNKRKINLRSIAHVCNNMNTASDNNHTAAIANYKKVFIIYPVRIQAITVHKPDNQRSNNRDYIIARDCIKKKWSFFA